MIARSISEIENTTCIKFYQEKSTDFIHVTYGNTSCSSNSVGRKLGQQIITLGSACANRGIGSMIHEFLHALGFYHEHQRPDRDENVFFYPENLKDTAG